MKLVLINILKTVFSDARKTISGVILLALLGGTGGVLYKSKILLGFLIQTANTPTPLWASTSMALLCCGYIYLKTLKKTDKTTQILPLMLTSKDYDIKIRMATLEEKILAIVAVNKKIRNQQIADVAQISEPLAMLHLNELKNRRLVFSQFAIDDNMRETMSWEIEQNGLKYLHHHGLLNS